MINGVDKLRELKKLLEDLNVNNDDSIHKVYFLPYEFSSTKDFTVYVSVDINHNRFDVHYSGFNVKYVSDSEEDSFVYSIIVYSDFDFEPFDTLNLDDVIGAIDKYRYELLDIDVIYFKPERILENLKPVLTFETSSSDHVIKSEVFGSVICKINVLNDLGCLLWEKGETE